MAKVAFAGLDVMARVSDVPSDVVVVTFTHKLPDGFPRLGFAERRLARAGVAYATFLASGSHGWQSAETDAAVRAVNDTGLLEGRKRVVLYGASMGAYGVLRWSRDLKATHVYAVAPQFSLDPKKTPFENRWRDDVARIAFDHDDMASGISRSAIVTAVYSSDDRRDVSHVRLLEDLRPIRKVVVAGGGHICLQVLIDAGALEAFEQAIAAGAEPNVLKAIYNAARRGSGTYFMAMAWRSLRQPQRAADLARCGLKITGSAPTKLTALLERALGEAQSRGAS